MFLLLIINRFGALCASWETTRVYMPLFIVAYRPFQLSSTSCQSTNPFPISSSSMARAITFSVLKGSAYWLFKLLLQGSEQLYPRLCPTLPKALGIYARNCRLRVPAFSGVGAHVRGHESSGTWALCSMSSWMFLHRLKSCVLIHASTDSGMPPTSR